MYRVFISYRREDTAGSARHLASTLQATFGRRQVFLDVSGIKPGVDFRKVIRAAITRARCMVVLIGPHWLEADAAGRRRIDDPDDFVRIEIASALAAGIRVIPVLVDGASMPKETELPAEVRPLSSRNALELRHLHWEADQEQLISDVYGNTPEYLRYKVRKSRLYTFVLKWIIACTIMVPTLMLLGYLFMPPKPMGDVFARLIADGRVKSAYLVTATPFRARMTEQEFQAQLQRTGLDKAVAVSWDIEKTSGFRGELKGHVMLRDGTVIPLTLLLTWEYGLWRVAELSTEEGKHFLPQGFR
jgi:hypothetical protein